MEYEKDQQNDDSLVEDLIASSPKKMALDPNHTVLEWENVPSVGKDDYTLLLSSVAKKRKSFLQFFDDENEMRKALYGTEPLLISTKSKNTTKDGMRIYKHHITVERQDSGF